MQMWLNMPEHHHVKPITLYPRKMKWWKWRTTSMVRRVHGTAREVGMASTDADHVGEIRNEGRIFLGNQPLGTILLKSQPAEQVSRTSVCRPQLRAIPTHQTPFLPPVDRNTGDTTP
jgi:hypothetical protein